MGVAYGAVLEGITASIVRVEADVSQGLPNFAIVGLPDSAVQESKLRIRAAMKNSGLPFPNSRITINLFPANVKKRGSGLDLAIALAILNATGYTVNESLQKTGFCGELSLSGQLAPVRGVVNLALALREGGFRRVVVAAEQSSDIVPIPNFDWTLSTTLAEVAAICRSGTGDFPNFSPSLQAYHRLHPGQNGEGGEYSLEVCDFSDVQGMHVVKRALTIAACGRHHTLLLGPPGCGKTMIAERFHTILPDLTGQEALEVFALHQACGVPRSLDEPPPLRNPHHSVTLAGLVGGGLPPTPGEVTLAHHGVLLLDELLEFQRMTLESLREPLSSRQVRVSRGNYHSVFPADFILLGTLNPCPCGQQGFGSCVCQPSQIHRYWSTLSGPLLDRIDLVIPVNPEERKSSGAATPENSASLRARITEAKLDLQERIHQIRHPLGDVHPSAQALLGKVSGNLTLSRRGLASVVRVARTISALEGDTLITEAHIHESLAFRALQKP